MKKALFLTLMASVAFAACTSDESLVPPQEIDFQVAKYLSTSRAVTGSVFTGSFGTYSFGLNDEMENEEISNASGVWKATTAYYWPVTGNTVDFISYAPYSSTTSPLTINNDNTIDITYTATGGVDFMLADYATGLNENVDLINGTEYKGVPTLFRHMLSNVSFEIGLTEDAIERGYSVHITEMKLTGIHNAGTIDDLAVDADDDATDNMQAWDLPDYWTSTSGNEIIIITPPSGYVTTPVAATLDDCYLLPQQFVATEQSIVGQQISIKYTLKYNNQEEVQNPIVRDLKGIVTGHAGWGINKKIVYNITIDVASNEIHFDPAVAEWDSTDGNIDVTL